MAKAGKKHLRTDPPLPKAVNVARRAAGEQQFVDMVVPVGDLVRWDVKRKRMIVGGKPRRRDRDFA